MTPAFALTIIPLSIPAGMARSVFVRCGVPWRKAQVARSRLNTPIGIASGIPDTHPCSEHELVMVMWCVSLYSFHPFYRSVAVVSVLGWLLSLQGHSITVVHLQDLPGRSCILVHYSIDWDCGCIRSPRRRHDRCNQASASVEGRGSGRDTSADRRRGWGGGMLALGFPGAALEAMHSRRLLRDLLRFVLYQHIYTFSPSPSSQSTLSRIGPPPLPTTNTVTASGKHDIPAVQEALTQVCIRDFADLIPPQC